MPDVLLARGRTKVKGKVIIIIIIEDFIRTQSTTALKVHNNINNNMICGSCHSCDILVPQVGFAKSIFVLTVDIINFSSSQKTCSVLSHDETVHQKLTFLATKHAKTPPQQKFSGG